VKKEIAKIKGIMELAKTFVGACVASRNLGDNVYSELCKGLAIVENIPDPNKIDIDKIQSAEYILNQIDPVCYQACKSEIREVVQILQSVIASQEASNGQV